MDKKYCPKTTGDFIGRKKIYSDLEKWLTKKSKSKIILIHGNYGVGKTSFIKKFLKETDMNACWYTQYNIPTPKDIQKSILSFQNNVDINMLFAKKKKDKILVIDNLDSFEYTNKTSIKILKNLFFTKNKKKGSQRITIPLIMIASDSTQNQLVTTIKKECTVINFKSLEKKKLLNIFLPIIEDLDIDYDPKYFNYIIDNSNGNINQIYYKLINMTTKYIIRKPNPFEVTWKLLTSYSNINMIYHHFEANPYIIPGLIQNNFNKIISQKECKIKEKKKIQIEIFKILSKSDSIINKIYKNPNLWSLHKIYGILSCVLPSLILSKYKNPSFYSDSSINLPKKTPSAKRITISNLCSNKFNNISTNDLLLIRQIIMFNIFNNNKKISKDLIKNFKLSKDDLISLLKIDKYDQVYKNTHIDKFNEKFQLLIEK